MAVTALLGVLSVKISADPSDFEKNLDSAKKQLKSAGKELRASANEWGKWAIAATAATAVAATAIVRSNLIAIRELNNTAKAANTLTKDFQQGAFAATAFGIEQEKYGQILQDVNDRIGDFITTGAGPMIDFFEQVGPKIGVTIDDFKKLSGQEAIGLFVSSLEKANLTQQEMTFHMEALASDATRLIPLFKDNAKAFKELTGQAKALNVGLSEIDVAKALAAQAALGRIAAVLESQVQRAVADLAPFITVIADELLELAEGAEGLGPSFLEGAEGAATAIGVMLDGLQGIKIIFKGLEVALRGFGAAATLIFGSFAKAVTGSLLLPLKGVLTVLAKFSDTAKAALGTVNAFADTVTKGVDDAVAKQIAGMEVAKAELQALALEELPSQQIDEFIQGVKDKAAAAAPEIAASLAGVGLGGEGTTGGESKEAQRIREENAQILEALLEQGLMREETVLGRIEREKAILDSARANELITAEEHARALLAIDEAAAATKQQIVSNTLTALATVLSLGGKKALKAQKVLAIAAAVIDGHTAAVAAWRSGMSTGGPWAPVVAAAYTAASIARTGLMIATLKGGGSATGGGGRGIPSVSTPSGSPGGGGGGGTGGPDQRIISVNFAGEGLLSTEQVRGIMSQINEQLSDGVQLLTGETS